MFSNSSLTAIAEKGWKSSRWVCLSASQPKIRLCRYIDPVGVTPRDLAIHWNALPRLLLATFSYCQVQIEHLGDRFWYHISPER